MYFCPVINETQPQKHVMQMWNTIIYDLIEFHGNMAYFSFSFFLTFPLPCVTVLTKNSQSKARHQS